MQARRRRAAVNNRHRQWWLSSRRSGTIFHLAPREKQITLADGSFDYDRRAICKGRGLSWFKDAVNCVFQIASTSRTELAGLLTTSPRGVRTTTKGGRTTNRHGAHSKIDSRRATTVDRSRGETSSTAQGHRVEQRQRAKGNKIVAQ